MKSGWSSRSLGLCCYLGVIAIGLGFCNSASAAPLEKVGQFCETGSSAGQCIIPRGLATDPNTGHVFVVDQANYRIQELDAWGGFVRAWGWGVVNGSPELQTCTTETSCGQGLSGSGSGQLGNFATGGIALDGAGNAYVVDVNNHRVQKFAVPADPLAPVSFVLMFGGEVDKTTNGNLCTAASGDSCGAGIAGNPGPGEGQFGQWPLEASFIAIDPSASGTVYVGDQNRIQVFGTDGVFEKQIALPEAAQVGSLAFEPLDGLLYFAYFNTDFTTYPLARHDVFGLDPETGEVVGVREVPIPRALATDAEGAIYVFDQGPANNSGNPANLTTRVLKFPHGAVSPEVIASNASPTTTDQFVTSSAIATSSPPTCGLESVDVYVANSRQADGFVALYGPPPNPAICPPPEAAPTIGDQFAASVDTGSARVKAKINPHYWPTTRFYVEYGTGKCSDGGCTSTAPASPGSLLTQKAFNSALETPGVLLGNLSPDTTYHYRFVAITRFEPGDGGEAVVRGVGGEPGNPGAESSFHTYALPSLPETDCPNQIFRTGLAAFLPDCRAYEMVSPVDKNDGDVLSWQEGLSLISPDGQRVTYSSFRGFSNPHGTPLANQYLAERGSNDWETQPISAPRTALGLYTAASSESRQLFKGFSDDLCSAGMVQDANVPLVAGAPVDVPNLYRRINCGTCPVPAFSQAEGGCYELLTPVPPPGFVYEPSGSIYFPEYQGSSADGTRSVLRADAALTPGACATPEKGIYQVYEAIQGNGLELVSVMNNGAAPCTHSSAGTYQGLVNGFQEDSLYHAVSADGRRVYWTNSAKADTPTPAGHDAGSGNQPGKLYLRVNIGAEQSAMSGSNCTEPEKACTIQVSQLVSEGAARFLTADPEGGTALFSVGQLLYRFNLEPNPTATEISKGTVGFVGASENLSRIYLVSTENHTGTQQNSQGDVAEAGQPNLYLYEEGGGFTFVAKLSAADITDIGGGFERPTLMSFAPNRRTSRVSSDGQRLVFTSATSLTGFDNRDAVSGQPDAELFLFDRTDGPGHLLCVSCNPSGARPRGRVIAGNSEKQFWSVARVPGWAQALRPTSPLSDSGQVFFESFEPLVLRDTNSASDVYTWKEADSKTQCISDFGGEVFVAESNGCLSLISAGKGSVDSYFLDATPDGSNVIIATDTSLLSQDPGLMDVYNARVNGGFPAPAGPPPACQGAGCQTPANPPSNTTPASSEFHGAGNVHEKPRRKCPQGKRKVKRKGKVRCVKTGKRRAGKHKKQRSSRNQGGSR